MIPNEVKEVLGEMIDLAGFSLDVLYGADAATAETLIENAKKVMAKIEAGEL
jgi:hypothetical protein